MLDQNTQSWHVKKMKENFDWINEKLKCWVSGCRRWQSEGGVSVCDWRTTTNDEHVACRISLSINSDRNVWFCWGFDIKDSCLAFHFQHDLNQLLDIYDIDWSRSILRNENFINKKQYSSSMNGSFEYLIRSLSSWEWVRRYIRF